MSTNIALNPEIFQSIVYRAADPPPDHPTPAPEDDDEEELEKDKKSSGRLM